MNKRILAIAMILVLVTAGLFAAPTAKVELVASIGEIPANTGIRILDGDGPSGAIDPVTFDPLFFSAPAEIQLTPTVDTAAAPAMGYFTVLVRRPIVSGVKITVSGSGLKLSTGNDFLAYTIKSRNASELYVQYAQSTGSASATTNNVFYEVTASAGSILRNQKTFRFDIPKSTGSPLGTYTADITFVLTTT